LFSVLILNPALKGCGTNISMPEVQQNFIMQPPKQSGSSTTIPAASAVVNLPAEAYQTYNKIIDPEGIFLNKLSRLLYSAILVKSDVLDESSPIPGYKLIEVGGKFRKTLVNWDGYNIITNNFIMLVSEVISTTEFDTKEINLKEICKDGVMAIIDQLVVNWDSWDFKDPMEIMPLAVQMWFNLYGVARRSTGGGKMLKFLTGIFKFLGPNRSTEEEHKDRVKFWRSAA